MSGAERPPERPDPEVRPRWGRLVAFGGSVLVTAVAVLGGLGVLPQGGSPAVARTAGSSSGSAVQAELVGAPPGADPVQEPDALNASPGGFEPAEPPLPVAERDSEVLPRDSGEGRRVVFDQGRQRVWLVRGDTVLHTYRVSGSVYDNLDPGSYAVYSRSKQAWGIDDSGTMRWMVRFARGDNAAIGFHDIPVDDGAKVQTRAQLGTPLSHGCIRQATPDAKALWRFAPVGTAVVVVA